MDQVSCADCGATSNLWLCLTCGNVGCGRYDRAHALAHNGRTNHDLAIDMATQHVWDYDHDEYVHRLMQDRSAEGGSRIEGVGADAENRPPIARMDNLSLEYTEILTSQLADQRSHFEKQLREATQREEELRQRIKQEAERSNEAVEKVATIRESFRNLEEEVIPQLRNSKNTAEQRASELERELSRVNTNMESLQKSYVQLKEHMLPETQHERDQAVARAEQASDAAAKVLNQLENLQQSYDSVTKEMIPGLERDKEKLERRAEKFEALSRQMEKEWREKDVINESLMDRISHLERQVNELTLKASDLEEQNHDLSFFISGMEKLKDKGDDVQGGTLSVPEARNKQQQRKRNWKR